MFIWLILFQYTSLNIPYPKDVETAAINERKKKLVSEAYLVVMVMLHVLYYRMCTLKQKLKKQKRM